jgi:hypothetical protein
MKHLLPPDPHWHRSLQRKIATTAQNRKLNVKNLGTDNLRLLFKVTGRF